eukprot:4672130-Ditylum_brightwellii.AAC.1
MPQNDNVVDKLGEEASTANNGDGCTTGATVNIATLRKLMKKINDINGAGESDSDVSNDDNDDNNKEKDITTAEETDDKCLLF